MKCVIIDDNPFTRMTLKAAIEKMGNQVVGEADSVSNAIQLLKKTDADVILLDLILPDGNGIELLSFINKNKKVIAITAVDQDIVDEELKKNGVKTILRKPFSYEELRKVLESII
ncbi:MAG: response regulator [Elusimicrobiales bacterium]|nr:response regulator [Elusimicrobiales bacterium]